MLRARRYVTLVTSVPVATSLPFSSARGSRLFFDLAAVEIAVAGSKGDKACCNFVRRLHHVGGVFVLGGVRSKLSIAVMPRGMVRVESTTIVRSAMPLGLLGGHNDVFVVGQHKHRLGGHALHSGHDIGRGGIHRLPAGHHGVSAKVGEDSLEALACGDGHESQTPGRCPQRRR